MITDKDVAKHVREVRSKSQYSATRLFISIIVILNVAAGVFFGILTIRQNVPLGAAIIALTVLFGIISKQMSIILIDIADSLHYQGAYEKFLSYMNARKQQNR